MHPMTTHRIATLAQQQHLDQAAAERLARQAAAGRPSLLARAIATLRPRLSRTSVRAIEPSTARPGQA